jgi:hypothetical protein
LTRCCLVAAIALTVAATTPTLAEAQLEVLSPVPNSSVISAYRGHIAWNQLDPATGLWSLMSWHGGITSRLPVPPRAVPFDIDLGPDALGRPVAVYSRCGREPKTTGGLALSPDWMTAARCDIYTVSMDRGPERLVRSVSSRHGSETTPSIWRGIVAFARRSPGRQAARLLLWRPGSKQLVRLAGGTLSRCLSRSCEGEPRPHAGADALDLGRRSLAVLWRLSFGNVVGTEVAWEMRSDRLKGRRSTLASSGYVSGTCGFEVPRSPNAAGRRILFLELVEPEDRCDATTRTSIVWINPKTRSRREAETSLGFALAAARDGEVIYWIQGPQAEPENAPGSDPCRSRPSACTLVRSRNLVFKRVPRRGVRRPTF